MTEILFIGTGPAITPAGRGNMAFVVRTAGATVLCECGPVVLDGLRRAGVDPSEIDTLFVSHRHGDHSLGFPMLVLHRMIVAPDRPLRVVAGRSVCEVLDRMTRMVYPEATDTLARVQWHALDEDCGGEAALAPQVSLHTTRVCGPRDVPVLGVRIDCADGSLAYSGDTSVCEPLARLALGCRVLIHESNFSARIDPSVDARFYAHSTASQAAQAARDAGVGTLALVHLSSRYAGREEEVAQEAREIFSGRVLVPSDGDRLAL
jgi:ribonuclease Z